MSINPDLQYERDQATFKIERMTHLLNGDLSGLVTEHKHKIRSLIPHNHPVFTKKNLFQLSREERFARGLALNDLVFTIVKDNNLSIEDKHILWGEIGEIIATSTHDSIFKGVIIQQGTVEQQMEWLPKCDSYHVVGCYAQTELGHGSNIRNLETTATFDEKTQEFELHSPTLTSSKWWPGSLGAVANHAAVFAQLIIKGKSYGLHCFIVQIRDMDTHKPLPGVNVGDIGPKMGMKAVDNGYLRLHHIRVPKHHMLSKFATIDQHGTYSKPAHSKANYGAMVKTRVGYIQDAGTFLSKAITIAVRYGAVRRQNGPRGKKQEIRILDYSTHQDRLLPLICASYALIFISRNMTIVYKTIEQGDLSMLGEIHSTVSGLKTAITTLVSTGMETCRKCCGGAGYMLASGIPDLFQTYTHMETAEGDNTVLAQQTSRYLLKLVSNPSEFKDNIPIGSDYAYLFQNIPQCTATTKEDFAKETVLLNALAYRSSFKVKELAKSQHDMVKAGVSHHDCWNNDLVELVEAATLHSEYVMAKWFFSGLENDATYNTSKDEFNILPSLAIQFAVWLLIKKTGALLLSGYMTPKQVKLLNELYKSMNKHIRPDAVALVDAFDLSDYMLGSAIGRYDGNVYEALYESTKVNQLSTLENGNPPGFSTHLKPLITSISKY